MNPHDKSKKNAKTKPVKKCWMTWCRKCQADAVTDDIWRTKKFLCRNELKYYRRTAVELENTAQIFALKIVFKGVSPKTPLKPRLLSPSLSEERSFFSWRPVTLYDKTHTQEQTTPIRVFLQLMQFLQCGATRFPLLYDLSRLLCDNPDTSWARPRMEERKYRSAQDVKNTSKFCGCTCTPCTKSWRVRRKISNESD